MLFPYRKKGTSFFLSAFERRDSFGRSFRRRTAKSGTGTRAKESCFAWPLKEVEAGTILPGQRAAQPFAILQSQVVNLCNHRFILRISLSKAGEA